jgi:hypothetical protein
VFVYEQLQPSLWARVFGHLFEIITKAFMRYGQPLGAEAVNEMYLGKTVKRLEQFTGDSTLMALKAQSGIVRINGRACPSLKMIWPRIEADARKLSSSARGSVIHGDLCFSNILYDLRSGICKLVDARGSFGEIGCMGDPRYDVAKLYHSVHGLYDFISADLCHVAVSEGASGSQITLDVRVRPQHQQIADRFDQVFFPRFDRREILLIEGLIFASIPALHYDHPRRQLAMYARALQIFAELYPVEESA